MIELLYASYGDKVEFDGHCVVICPDHRRVAAISEQELRARCKLGFRAPYVLAAAKAVAQGLVPSLDILESMTAEEARTALVSIKGIGEYAANTILPHPAFPVDTWSAPIFARLLGIESAPGTTIRAVKKCAEDNFGKWQRDIYTYVVNDLDRISARLGEISARGIDDKMVG